MQFAHQCFRPKPCWQCSAHLCVVHLNSLQTIQPTNLCWHRPCEHWTIEEIQNMHIGAPQFGRQGAAQSCIACQRQLRSKAGFHRPDFELKLANLRGQGTLQIVGVQSHVLDPCPSTVARNAIPGVAAGISPRIPSGLACPACTTCRRVYCVQR